MDQSEVRAAVVDRWTGQVMPSLAALVEIPALSPGFDADWAAHGHLRAAVDHVRAWIAARGLPGARFEVVELEGCSPLLLADVPATPGAADKGTVILYGHLDKQPPVGGWSEGLGPWKAVVRDGRLYGRGAVDDGYSGYAATTALEAVNAAGGEHARAVLLLETGEESGSSDLPAYMEHLAGQLGDVTLVVCLDAGGGDYERLWLTQSLRGVVQATVTVRVLEKAQHSGLASGIVPSSFRIMRQLLDRLEDAATGEIRIAEMNVPIPDAARAAAEQLVAFGLGPVMLDYPLVAGMRPADDDEIELLLNNTWRPTLSVIGGSGLPEPADAGNVLRTATTLKLSFRTPPTADGPAALDALEKALTTDVPYGAQVEITENLAMNGWSAPVPAPWLAAALGRIGDEVFGNELGNMGMGGSIPFMELLGRLYPQAQFVVTGALGTDSNMHVPDEWLHIGFAQQVTEAIAHILDAHARG
ncbi:MAG TPA: M20/M25/M40 family metallo-hydrolase [Actinocrinis sp.]|jgi:acetylornithine deacetylase/succinyl-diaminopimelate desuccinylase-like protein